MKVKYSITDKYIIHNILILSIIKYILYGTFINYIIIVIISFT